MITPIDGYPKPHLLILTRLLAQVHGSYTKEQDGLPAEALSDATDALRGIHALEDLGPPHAVVTKARDFAERAVRKFTGLT
jgi:hypothetical protein